MDKKRSSERQENDTLSLLLEHQRELRDTLQQCETLIYEKETEDLDATDYGNIVRGWDGYIDSKLRREPAPKRSKVSDAERIFSLSSVSSSVAEPAEASAGASQRKKGTSAGAGAAAVAATSQSGTRERSKRDKRKRKRGYADDEEEEAF